jgi:hypothetical protein
MSTLLWIGIVLAGIVGIIIIIAAVYSRGKRLFMEKGGKGRLTDKEDYLRYQRIKVEEMQRRKPPAHEIYQYAASEVGRIFSSGDIETETRMNWLNAWGMILNHELKPKYTSEVWEEEGFRSLHLKISEYAKQISPKGLDFPARLDFDEVYAKYKDRI